MKEYLKLSLGSSVVFNPTIFLCVCELLNDLFKKKKNTPTKLSWFSENVKLFSFPIGWYLSRLTHWLWPLVSFWLLLRHKEQKADLQNYMLLNDWGRKNKTVDWRGPNTEVYFLHIWTMSLSRNKQALNSEVSVDRNIIDEGKMVVSLCLVSPSVEW